MFIKTNGRRGDGLPGIMLSFWIWKILFPNRFLFQSKHFGLQGSNQDQDQGPALAKIPCLPNHYNDP